MVQNGGDVPVATDGEDDQGHAVEVPIEFVIPEGFGLLYSDFAFVQSTQDEFIISFFQGGHPLVKSREEMEKMEVLRSYCVARIVLSPAQMKS